MRTATAWVPLALIAAAAVLGGCSSGGASADSSPSADPDVASLALGDCVRMVQGIDTSGNETQSSLEVADCAKNHHGEVVLADGQFFTSDKDLPADEQLVAKSEAACAQAMYDYTGHKLEDTSFRMSYLYPTDASWATGDRKLTCIAWAYDEDFGSVAEVTGSIRQSE